MLQQTSYAVGPIADVALALATAPEIAGRLKRIVAIGSTTFHPSIPGIASSMADAHYWNDPEGAPIVLRSGAPIMLVGIDVAMRVLLTGAIRAEITRRSGLVGAHMVDIAGRP